MASAEDALRQWDSTAGGGASPRIVSGIFSGTAMLNRLLERKGRRVGCIVTAGQEDYAAAGARHPDLPRLSPTPTASTSPPTTTTSRWCRAIAMKGVRGRIDLFGDEVAAAARGEDAREAVDELLDDGVEGIVVSLLFSYRNPEHEQRVRRDRRGGEGRARASTAARSSSPRELYPLRRDFPRLNSTLIEAYAAEPSRGTAAAPCATAPRSAAPASSCG